MKKKFLSILLALALCVTLLPTAALAEDTAFPTDGIVINETTEDRSYTTDDGGTVSYNKAKKTLTLDNATITANPTGNAAVIEFSGAGNYTIELIGTNKIESFNCIVLSKPSSDTNSLTIAGAKGATNASLTLTSTWGLALSAGQSSLTVENCTLDIKGPDVSDTNSSSFAMSVKAMTLKSGAAVTVTPGTGGSPENHQQNVSGPFVVENGASFTLNAGTQMIFTGTDSSLAVNRGGTFTVAENSTVEFQQIHNTLTNGGTFTNYGTVQFEGGADNNAKTLLTNNTGGTFTNYGTVSFENKNDLFENFAELSNSGTFENNGVLSFERTGVITEDDNLTGTGYVKEQGESSYVYKSNSDKSLNAISDLTVSDLNVSENPISSGSGYSWDSSTNTLTLKNAVITGALTLPNNGDVTIKTADYVYVNRITNGTTAGDPNNLIFDGATLTVGGINWNHNQNYSQSKTNDYIILSNHSTLTVNGDEDSDNNAGELCAGGFTIKGGSKIVLSGAPISSNNKSGIDGLTDYIADSEDYSAVGGPATWYLHEKTGTTTADEGTPTDTTARVTRLTLQQPTCTVTFDSNGGSAVAKQTVYRNGTATRPADDPTRDGFTFVQWVDKTGVAYDFSKAVTEDITLTAQWTPKENIPTPSGTGGSTYHTITATAGTGGSISPSGAVSVLHGNDRTFTVSPAQGYVLSDLLVDGQSVGALTSYTFANVRTSHTIKAVFEADAADRSDRPVGLNSTDHMAYVQGYADGTVRPNASITRAQVAVMLYRLLTPERLAEIETDIHSFTDMTAADWYSHEVATMANGGYITGYADGRFGGNDPITRAQFVTVLTRFLSQRDVDCDFTDVPESYWAYDAIAAAVDAGWITGYADGTFRPDQPITRAQVMAIINRALDRGVDADSTLAAGCQTFTDNPVTAWHYYEVLEAANGHDYTGRRPSENWTALK